MIYFDNAASRKMKKQVELHLMEELQKYPYNPSGLYTGAIQVKNHLNDIREQIQELIPFTCDLIFTSGATEANNTVLKNYFKKGAHIITSSYEHPSVREVLSEMERNGLEVTWLKDISDQSILREMQENTVLVSIMHINNEVGMKFSLTKTYEECKKRKIAFHRDCVQSFFKYPLPKADYLTISGHKIGALKGIGALVIHKGNTLSPLLVGGEQEQGKRAGTENIAGILSFGLALSTPEDGSKVRLMNQYIKQNLPKDTVVLTPMDGSDYILCIAVKGVPSEIIMNDLNRKGIYLSSGSACSQRSSKVSHTIKMMGFEESVQMGVLRISLCSDNTMEEVETFCLELENSVTSIRKVIG